MDKRKRKSTQVSKFQLAEKLSLGGQTCSQVVSLILIRSEVARCQLHEASKALASCGNAILLQPCTRDHTKEFIYKQLCGDLRLLAFGQQPNGEKRAPTFGQI